MTQLRQRHWPVWEHRQAHPMDQTVLAAKFVDPNAPTHRVEVRAGRWSFQRRPAVQRGIFSAEEGMELVFVRHAESLGNAQGRWQGRQDSGLTDLGRRQAAKLGERFASEGFEPTHIYASPLSRTYETARIVSTAWDRAIAPWDDLMEIDVGVIEGKTWDEFVRDYPDVARGFDETRDWDRVPGAETLGERRGRARGAIERLVADHSNEDRVLAFTHGGIIQHLFAVLMDSERLWGMSVRNTALFDFTLDVERWHQDGIAMTNPTLWRINRFNDASHLG